MEDVTRGVRSRREESESESELEMDENGRFIVKEDEEEEEEETKKRLLQVRKWMKRKRREVERSVQSVVQVA